MEKEMLKLLKKIHKSCEANNKTLKKILKSIESQNVSEDENTYNGLEPVGDIYITHNDGIEWDSTPTVYIGEEQ